jgi:peroxiredoxin
VSLRALPLVTLVLDLLLPVAAGAEQVPRPPEIGQPLPDFEATSLEGQAVSLRAVVGGHKAVVILFLSTVCPYVNHFADYIRELNVRYGPQGVLFVGINSNNWESREEVAEHARQHGFAFAIVKDEKHRIADRLGADRTPEAFLVDAEGRLRYRGWVKSKQESPDLQRALDAVLKGRPVSRPLTKAFGCAVDRF